MAPAVLTAIVAVWLEAIASVGCEGIALNFGCVWISCHIALVAEMPHGGLKHSGCGRNLSKYGFEDYTRVKHVMSHVEA